MAAGCSVIGGGWVEPTERVCDDMEVSGEKERGAMLLVGQWQCAWLVKVKLPVRSLRSRRESFWWRRQIRLSSLGWLVQTRSDLIHPMASHHLFN